MSGNCELHVYRVVIMLSLVACSGGQRFSRRAGDQADEGKCLSFWLGGDYWVHWYTCCNNCNSQDTSCDGKTYHGASNGTYCDACGTDNKAGDGYKRFDISDFSCGGCTGQEEVLNECRLSLGWHYVTKGYCWEFSLCFEDLCKKQDDQGITPKATAYDGVCNDGETEKDSPVDCCQKVNDACKWVNGTCPPKCCGEPDCCRTSAGTNTVSASAVLLSMVAVFLALKQY